MTGNISFKKNIKGYKICAIVVTYNPDIKILRSLLDVALKSVSYFVIVNNGCNPESLLVMQQWQESEQISLIDLGGNLGLAYGLNQGILFAQSKKFSHVILFDQDSIPDQEMIPKLIKADATLREEVEFIAALGPSHKDPRTGFQSRFSKIGRFYKCLDGINLFFVSYLQTSGSLISIDIFTRYGLMDERLFIHHVDQEWFYRLAKHGYSGFGVQEACMSHLVGDKTITIPLGINRDVHLYSPFRNYFVVRNTIILCKRTYVPLRWKIANSVKIILIFIFHILFVKPRFEQLQMMTKGVFDGLFNVESQKA
jgi:rhamnosyltransferase